MKHELTSTVVAVAAIAAAVAVDVHGGDADKYLAVAIYALGYASGSVIAKVKNRK